MSRLVMIHGVCWGVGQSTLARRLASAIGDVDVLWEDELPEPSIFTRPEFGDVADRFHRHNHQPTAGVGHPEPELLEEAYRRLVDTVLAHQRTALMAWSVIDLAEDLDWARTDEDALHRHALQTRAVFAPLNPELVYLSGDLSIAMRRAVAQRGSDWFRRAYGQPGEAWKDLERRLLAEMAEAAARIDRAFDFGGWFPAVTVDATAAEADDVYAVVVSELRKRGISVDT
jgi:hypothetical protein